MIGCGAGPNPGPPPTKPDPPSQDDQKGTAVARLRLGTLWKGSGGGPEGDPKGRDVSSLWSRGNEQYRVTRRFWMPATGPDPAAAFDDFLKRVEAEVKKVGT